MQVKWKVDPVVLRFAWRRLNAIPDKVSRSKKELDTILDIGGGSGWFGLRLKKYHPNARVFCLDPVPRVVDNGVEHIRGSGLDIPFKLFVFHKRRDALQNLLCRRLFDNEAVAAHRIALVDL